MTESVAGDIARARGGGRPLPGPTRSFFESRFGHGFGDVRVHDGSRAARLNRALDARAFTYGRDVFFGTNQYRPESGHGKRLLAHELTHVVQQRQRDVSHVQRQPESVSQDQPQQEEPASLRASVDYSSVNLSELESEIERLRQWLLDNPTHPEATRMAETLRHIERFYAALVEAVNVPERVQLIRELLDDPLLFGWAVDWISTTPEEALKVLWGGFGENLLWVAGQHLDLWRRSIEEGAPLSELAELQPFLTNFENAAIEETRATLEEGRYRIQAEADRYGIETEWIPGTDPDFFVGPSGMTHWYGGNEGRLIATGMAENPATAGLTAAAKELAEVQGQLYEVHRGLGQKEAQLIQFVGFPDPQITQEIDDLRQQRSQLEPRHAELRFAFTAQYPILAQYTDDVRDRADLHALQQISRGVSDDTATELYETIQDRLSDVATVLTELEKLERGEDADLSVWKVERIRTLTKSKLGIQDETLEAAMIASKVQDVETEEMIQEMLLGGLALGLGLIAAIPSGGSSLVAAGTFIAGAGSFAIGAYQAAESIDRYVLESAMAGTAFDRAQALAQEDPSMFWLAFEIVSVAVEGADVLRGLFRTIRPLVAANRAADLGAIERAARTQGLDSGTTRRLIERIASHSDEAGGLSADAVRAFTRHDEAVAGASGRLLDEAVDAVASGRQIVSRSGHTVTLLPNGRLVICSSCSWIRGRYAGVLADPQNERLNELLIGIERRAEQFSPDSPIGRGTLADAAELVDWLERAPLSRGAREALERGWPPARPGYRWVLGHDGTPRLDRVRIETPERTSMPQQSFDPMSRGFGSEGVAKAAKLGPPETLPTVELPSQTRIEMDALLDERRQARITRDRLEARQVSSEALSTARGDINRASEALGEAAASAYIRHRYGLPSAARPAFEGSGPGVFDQVWVIPEGAADGGTLFVVVEAKGGSGRRGSRLVEGQRVEQGTPEYLGGITRNMQTSGSSPSTEQMGRELQLAIKNGKVRYVEVNVPISDTAGQEVYGDIQIRDYLL